ncbi:uncharacterized protein SCHCODRAFT_02705342 [Schizophyllum commune H4-8]|uniref:uncharacterized protein n=1 Tax=Schizophyllum commune (strain H4-8 / FGSC 9210) TaxID=578458 RepID=UPI00215FBC56|nr:uncharacterized protein SCHCODRAFT_02705342 [Schizophyllum commune H4-8]KAI5888064.1 hypothetical protein SCHCODRAFT_02705342 [Schizophyllum commune H4-8]
MFGYDNPQATFPEVQLCREMIRHTFNISNDCYRIRYRIAALHAQLVISETAQDTLRCVGNYVLCVSDTIDACFQLFLAIRRTIESNDISLESGLATIHDRYRSFIQLLAELASMEDPTLRSLDCLQNYIDTKLSYPPVVHTLVMRVLGLNWSHREIVLTQVPPLLNAARTSVKDIAALTAELTVQGTAMTERFALSRLGEVKTLPAQARSEVGWLFSQSFGGLPFWADKAKVHGSCILNLAVPVLPIDCAL